ncbi:sugar phosphate isomerase/epimerase [Candidatus Acetothermia bacterium]|nr:sugar phosphate isomerase/epimerase [Candidatus Acetothermia bacterium]
MSRQEGSKCVGLSLRPDRICGNFATLKRDLLLAAKLGFAAVEIPIHGVDTLLDGRLRQSRLREIKQLLDEFPFRLTVHAPDTLNLQDEKRWSVQRDLFEACIAFSAEIGAEVLVYHQGSSANGEAHLLAKAEIGELIRLGRIARSKGIRIGVENGSRPIFSLIELIKEVDQESVGITYDFGHAYLTANFFGYAILTGLCAALPYIIHLHLHDNLGRVHPDVIDPLTTRELHITCPLGEGDLHLPPGWGKIPYHRAFETLAGYDGIFMLELHKRFFERGYSLREDHAEIRTALVYVEQHLNQIRAAVPAGV